MGKGHAAVGLFPILAEYGYIEKDVLDGYTRLETRWVIIRI